MTPPRLAVFAAAGLGAALLAGCGTPGQQGTQAAGAAERATLQNGVQVLTVKAGDDLRFAETSLSAHPGKVKIILDVTGDVPHNLAFSDGPQADTGTVSHGSAPLTLTFAKPGTYHFLCTIHPRMQGTLTIK